MTSSYHENQWLSRAQSRQQLVLTVLAAALVASTIMTWMLVSAIRESNDLQRQLLVTQQTEPVAKPAVKRRAGASAASKAQAEPRRSAIGAAGRERRKVERAPGDSKPATQIAATHDYLNRQGRQ